MARRADAIPSVSAFTRAWNRAAKQGNETRLSELARVPEEERAAWEASPRLRCFECGERYDEVNTTLVPGLIGGDYRRASRHGEVRVCVFCAERQLRYALSDTGTWLNTGRIKWERACRDFGIVIPPGTPLDRMIGKYQPE